MASSADKSMQILSASFQSLPTEIREQIWLETLPPRIIYLTPHHHFSPHSEDGYHKPFDFQWLEMGVGFEYTTNATYATPAEVFAAYEPSAASKNGLNREKLETGLAQTGGRPKFQASTAPPAIGVCHESRAIAIARGYVLAFKDVNMRWKKRDLSIGGDIIRVRPEKTSSEKGIWIDFNHDLIMLYTRSKLKMLPTHFNLPLNILHEWASDDVKRIKRLGLHGPSNMILSALRGKYVGVSHNNRWISTHQWWVKMGFENVEEIWIDEEVGENNSELYFDANRRYHNGQSREDAIEQYLGKISEGKALLDHWIAPLPQVRVIRGEWDEYFGI